MNNNNKTSVRQHFNYSRIPNSIIESTSLSYIEKKILLFSYGIQVHWHVPVVNLLKGWKNDKQLPNTTPLPSQLRKLLRELEQKGLINRIFTNRKFTAIKLNTEHKLVTNSKYFFVSKEIFSNSFLTLDNIVNAICYTRFHHSPKIYGSKLASLLGVDIKTFRKNNQRLINLGLLRSEMSRNTQRYFITTYKLNPTVYVNKHSNKTLSKSINTQVDDISPLKYYFLKKITNNNTMQGILRMERKNNSKTLDDYLNLTANESEWMINSVQMILNQMGMRIDKGILKEKVLEILINNSKRSKLRFLNDYKFYSFVAHAIFPKNNLFEFNILDFKFISKMKTLLPFHLPELVLINEFKKVQQEGFKFKTEEHASKFLYGRLTSKKYSETVLEAGIVERDNNLTSEQIHTPRINSIGNILKGLIHEYRT